MAHHIVHTKETARPFAGTAQKQPELDVIQHG